MLMLADLVCSAVSMGCLRPYLADNDAIHLMHCERRILQYFTSVQPYELKHSIFAPSDSTLIASTNGPLRIISLIEADERDTSDLSLPPWIKHIALAYSRCNISPHSLPPRLQSLHCSDYTAVHDNEWTRVLPESLVYLRVRIKGECPQSFVDSLPATLQTLDISRPCGRSLSVWPNLSFPPALTDLYLDKVNSPLMIRSWPTSSLLHLHIDRCTVSLSGQLPPNLLTLCIDTYDFVIEDDTLPASLRTLILSQNQPLQVSALPRLLTRCSVQNLFINDVNEQWPPFLTDLRYIHVRFEPIVHFARALSLRTLSVSLLDDDTIRPGTLPPLTELTVNGSPTIEPNALPPSLRSLTLAQRVVNHSITLNNMLQHGLTYLHLSEYIHKLMPGTLPATLLVLIMGSYSHKLQPHVLPSSLTQFTLYRSENQILTARCLPKSLITLTISDLVRIDVDALPSSLRKLSASLHKASIHVNTLPRSLTELDLRVPHQFTANMLPPSLTSLTSDLKHSIVSNFLPPSLLKLQLQHYTQKLEVGDLGPQLTYLALGRYNIPLETNILPKSLTFLELEDYSYDIPSVPTILPNSLLYLKLSGYSARIDAPIGRHNIKRFPQLRYEQE